MHFEQLIKESTQTQQELNERIKTAIGERDEAIEKLFTTVKDLEQQVKDRAGNTERLDQSHVQLNEVNFKNKKV